MEILKKLKYRLDQEAVTQLRDEVLRLDTIVSELKRENEKLEQRAYLAEEWAESWRDDFMALQLSEYPDSSPGITQDGRLTIAGQGD